MAAPILVFCPNGHVFESRQYRLSGRGRLQLEGNFEDCPICGVMAPLMEGTFDLMGDSIRLLAAPQTTLDQLNRLRTVLLRIRDEGLPPEQAAPVIAEEAPELADVARNIPRDRIRAATYLAVLMTLVQTLLMLWDQIHPADTVSGQDVERIIEKVMQTQRASPGTSPPPQSTPPTSQPNPPVEPEPPAPAP